MDKGDNLRIIFKKSLKLFPKWKNKNKKKIQMDYEMTFNELNTSK